MTNVLSCRALGAGQDLKEFDVDNYYGLAALTRILDDCVGKKLHMEAVQARINTAYLLRQPGCSHCSLTHFLSRHACIAFAGRQRRACDDV